VHTHDNKFGLMETYRSVARCKMRFDEPFTHGSRVWQTDGRTGRR